MTLKRATYYGRALEQSFSADITLNAHHARYRRLSPQAPGLKVKLPNATLLPLRPGGPVFQLHNTGNFAFSLVDLNNVEICLFGRNEEKVVLLSPGRGASTAAGAWHLFCPDFSNTPAGDSTIETAALTAQHTWRGPQSVWTGRTTAYVFFLNASAHLVYRKITSVGNVFTVSSQVTIYSSTAVGKFRVWYDKWTPGDTGSKIHIGFLDPSGDRALYRNLDVLTDTFGSLVVAKSINIDSVADAHLMILTKARGGNLYIGVSGQLLPFNGSAFVRSVDGGATWADRNTANFLGPNTVGAIMFPGNEVDNQDIWVSYLETTGTPEIRITTHDDSGNSWTGGGDGTVISAMTPAAQPGEVQMDAAIRHADNHMILAAWNDFNTAGADLKVWDINGESSIVAKTDALTDLDNAAQVGLLINQRNDDLFIAILTGISYGSAVEVKYVKSTDGASTWSALQDFMQGTPDNLRGIYGGVSIDDEGGHFMPVWFNEDTDDLETNVHNAVAI